MPWRVCRIIDFHMSCASVHGTEDMAKVETGRHLAALITKLEEDLPKYAGIWNYPRVHPGFVEDVRTTIDSMAAYLQEDEVWAAYDDWQHFLNQWEPKIKTPLWAQVGTVIVEGPGPTVVPLHDPSRRIQAKPRTSRVQPRDPARQADLIWHTLLKAMAQDLMERNPQVGGRSATLKEVLDVIEEASQTIDTGEDLKSEEQVAHWLRLVWIEAAERFGVTP